MNEEVNLPVLALMSSINACLEISSMLPEADLCQQLKEVLEHQMDIIIRMETGESFDEDEVVKYCLDCDYIVQEIRLIKESYNYN